MKISWLVLVLATGILIPAQAAMNAKMRMFVLNPMYSALINFGIGAIALIVVTFVTVAIGQASSWRGASEAPWWAWCGGFVGALFVTVSVLSIPHIGATGFSIAVIAGQLFGAVIVDHFGWFGLEQHLISTPRMIGVGLLMAGVWLIQRS